MMKQLTEEDFARGVKNPHFHKLMRNVEVPVSHEDYATFCEFAELNDVPVKIIMRKGLMYWAKELREED